MDNETILSGEALPVVEEFYSVQGEGLNAGQAAYFVRLAGCDVCCDFCDSRNTWKMNDYQPVDGYFDIDLKLDNIRKYIIISQFNMRIIFFIRNKYCIYVIEYICIIPFFVF